MTISAHLRHPPKLCLFSQATNLIRVLQWLRICWVINGRIMNNHIVPSAVHLGKIIVSTSVLIYSAFVRYWRQHVNVQCHSTLDFKE